jgi:hypothetical protein
MTCACPNYHDPKGKKSDTVKLSPQLVTKLNGETYEFPKIPEKHQCPLIKSIDENLSTDFGKEYREKFCYRDFKDCKYKEATDVFD